MTRILRSGLLLGLMGGVAMAPDTGSGSGSATMKQYIAKTAIDRRVGDKFERIKPNTLFTPQSVDEEAELLGIGAIVESATDEADAWKVQQEGSQGGRMVPGIDKAPVAPVPTTVQFQTQDPHAAAAITDAAQQNADLTKVSVQTGAPAGDGAGGAGSGAPAADETDPAAAAAERSAAEQRAAAAAARKAAREGAATT